VGSTTSGFANWCFRWCFRQLVTWVLVVSRTGHFRNCGFAGAFGDWWFRQLLEELVRNLLVNWSETWFTAWLAG
jgi:hypothetical protein